jgi:ADP-ribose pyrophosphatase YjhB (NUDIX family)
MNWIQQHILIELTRHPTRRYSELRPDSVEGNLFLYHLNGLIKDGLVEKTGRDYHLSMKGLRTAGLLSLETGKLRAQPKILNAIICTDDAGRYLLSRWHRQPNTGLVSFPHGMMHYGAAHLDMAARELAEKANLAADLNYLGEVYIRGFLGEEIDRHMLIHLFQATNARPLPDSRLRPEVSEPFWEHLESIPADAFVPGFYELAQIVQVAAPTEHIYQDLEIQI